MALNPIEGRILNKRSSITGTTATSGTSTDHTDGTWNDTDIYIGEFFMNTTDDILQFRDYEAIKGINQQDLGNEITRVTYDIGTWDMDAGTTNAITVPVDLTEAQVSNVRSIFTSIVDDSDVLRRDFDSNTNAGTFGTDATAISYTGTTAFFTLQRAFLGVFDSASYSSTLSSRGTITIEIKNP